MQKKKLKKIMIASGVIGSILSAKGVTVNATTVNNGISVASISS